MLRCREFGTFVQCGWQCEMEQLLWKKLWQFLERLTREQPDDPAISLLGVYPREMKARFRYLNRDVHGSIIHYSQGGSITRVHEQMTR